jgi:hypothetical protein
MITHRMSALAVADRVLQLAERRVAQDAPPGRVTPFVPGARGPAAPWRPQPTPV